LGLSVSFENCVLNNATFFSVKLKDTSFKGCALKEVDFTGADLTQANFAHSDLSNAVFGGTNLTKADFSEAVGYALSPERNNIKGAKFALSGLPGLLTTYGIKIVP
jgi:uncharacterized protein YjbI with pentapeptide repeats